MGDSNGGEWQARHGAARALRVVLQIIPFAVSFAASTAVSRLVRPHVWTLANRVASLVVAGVVAVLTSIAVTRWLRRFLPLAWLCELNLAFPTAAPSRIRFALRAGMSHRAAEIRETFVASGLSDDPDLAAQQVLELVASIHRHDRFTRGHCEKTRAVADVIGEQLGLSAADRNRLRWAAMLHDIGKLAVPAAILNSPGKPTAEEWKILQGHPAAGASRIAPLRSWLGDWVLAVDQHHERFDGGGYPYGLAGEAISLSGRIVAVADSYEVMTAVRSYKKAMTPEAARAELTRCAGSHFDPHVVRAFLDVGTKRHPVVTGLLSSWLGRLLLGDGPVASMLRSVGQTVSAGASAGAGASVPVVFAAALPIAAITQTPAPVRPVERAAVAVIVEFAQSPRTWIPPTSSIRPVSTTPAASTSLPRAATTRPFGDDGHTALALVSNASENGVLGVPSTATTASLVASTLPATTTTVATTVARTSPIATTSTTVGGVGGLSIPTSTRSVPTDPATPTTIAAGGSNVRVIPGVTTPVPTGITSVVPPPTVPDSATSLPGGPTTLLGATSVAAASTVPASTVAVPGSPTVPTTVPQTVATSTMSATTLLATTLPSTVVPTTLLPTTLLPTTLLPTTLLPTTTVAPTTTAAPTTTVAPTTTTGSPLSGGPCGQPNDPFVSPATVMFHNRTSNRVLRVMFVDDNCNETLAGTVLPDTWLPIPCDTGTQFLVRSVKLPRLDHPRLEVDRFRPTAGAQTVTVN